MGLYARCIDRWERRLVSRDNNRFVRQFDWGLEWLKAIEADNGYRAEEPSFEQLTSRWLADSGSFFSYLSPSDFSLENRILSFTSAVRSPYPENDLVRAAFFPSTGKHRAVIVLPQWNADEQGHVGLCKLLNRFGITALRLTLPYHAARRPAEIERAEYHVSSNLGRTIHACRQSVIDTRSCVDWLQSHGYRRLGILGTSLGSCIAFIAAAHDDRLSVGAFNHVSTYFGDVVWTGLSTLHIRRALEAAVTQDELRRYWAIISPATYLNRMKGRDFNSLLVWASHDSSFLPRYSKDVLARFKSVGLRHEVRCIPCGHYTTGQFPFNWIDGLTLCRYLDRNL